MESSQDSKLNMERAVEKLCDANPTIVSSVPAFDNAVGNFKNKVAEIIATIQHEKLAISGITDDKVLAKKALCRIAADTASPIFVYASTTNNAILKQQVNYSYSSLFSIVDDELAPIAQNIHNAGKANLAVLASFGITTPVLAIFQTVIDSFEQKESNPKNAASIKKTIRTNLKTLFKESDIILKEHMDKTVLALQTTYPDFVLSYKENRVVIDPKKTSARLKGKVISAVDGSPIHGAVISLDNTLFAAISNSKGKYAINYIPFGDYAAIVTAPSFADINGDTVKIKLGKITILDVEMLPLEVPEKTSEGVLI